MRSITRGRVGGCLGGWWRPAPGGLVGVTCLSNALHTLSPFALDAFPESHALSFTLIADTSAYLKPRQTPNLTCSPTCRAGTNPTGC